MHLAAGASAPLLMFSSRRNLIYNLQVMSDMALTWSLVMCIGRSVNMLGPIYRERAAKMYARASYITAVGVVELPYLVAQTLVFVPISYFMIGELADRCHLTFHGHFRALSCPGSWLAGSTSQAYPHPHPS